MRMPLIHRFRHYILGVLILVALAGIISVSAFPPLDNELLTAINKNGMDLELRSEGRMIADEMLNQVTLQPDSPGTPVHQESNDRDVKFRGANVQVNDGALDHIQILPDFRPFVSFTQSEATVALGDKNG